MKVVPYFLTSEIALFNYHPGCYIHSDWLLDFINTSEKYICKSNKYYQILSKRIIDTINGKNKICNDFSILIRRLCLVENVRHVALLLGSYIYWFVIVNSMRSDIVKSWISILGENDYFWIVKSKKIPFINYKIYSKNISSAAENCDKEKMEFLLYQSGVRIIKRLLLEEHCGLWNRMMFKFPKNVVNSKLHDFPFYSSEVLRNIVNHILFERLPEWQNLTN